MKTIYKNLFAAFILLFVPVMIFGQEFNSAYFTKGYSLRHQMNPAFDNDSTSYLALPAIGSTNVKTMGNFGCEDIFFDNPDYPSTSDKKKTTFMNPYITNPLAGFKDMNRFSAYVNMNIFSYGFKGFKGYNTIEMNVRANMDGKIPYELFDFAANTGNKSYDIGDISLRAQSYAEIALGHSHQINKNLRIGAKLKALIGITNAAVDLKNMRADLSGADQWTVSGTADAHVSMKGFSFKSETKEYKNQYAGHDTYQHVSDVDVDKPGVGGFGMAVDLGAVYKINDDFTVSAALLDLGFISWSNDVYATNGSTSFTFSGFHDTGVNTNDNTVDNQADDYSDQLSDFANLKDKGDQGSRTTNLDAKLNLGVEYTLPVYRKIKFGFLESTRFGKFSWTEGRLSANYEPLKWLDGGVNLAVNTFTTSVGWILNIHPHGVNIFVGMDHIVGKMSKEYIPLSSNASLSAGISITF
jgi:hypothetical protein